MSRLLPLLAGCAWCAASTLHAQQAAAAAATTNAPPKTTPWDITAAAGLTLTSGNSKTVLGTASLHADKKWDAGKNELGLGADTVYGENNSVKTAEQDHGFGQYNRLLSDRAFAYGRVEGLHDAIADVDLRLSVGPGAGYYLLKSTNCLLRVEAGPGYVYEQDSNGSDKSYMSLRLAERYEQKITAVAKIWEAVEILPQVDKFGNYIVTAEAGVETAMSKQFSLMAFVQDWYHSEPSAGRLKNDLKLVTALKYKF